MVDIDAAGVVHHDLRVLPFAMVGALILRAAV